MSRSLQFLKDAVVVEHPPQSAHSVGDPLGKLAVSVSLNVDDLGLDELFDPLYSCFGQGGPCAMHTRDHVVRELRKTLVKRPAVLEEQLIRTRQHAAGIKSRSDAAESRKDPAGFGMFEQSLRAGSSIRGWPSRRLDRRDPSRTRARIARSTAAISAGPGSFFTPTASKKGLYTSQDSGSVVLHFPNGVCCQNTVSGDDEAAIGDLDAWSAPKLPHNPLISAVAQHAVDVRVHLSTRLGTVLEVRHHGGDRRLPRHAEPSELREVPALHGGGETQLIPLSAVQLASVRRQDLARFRPPAALERKPSVRCQELWRALRQCQAVPASVRSTASATAGSGSSEARASR